MSKVRLIKSNSLEAFRNRWEGSNAREGTSISSIVMDEMIQNIEEIVLDSIEKERERIYKMIPIECRGHIGEAEMRKAGIDMDKYE